MWKVVEGKRKVEFKDMELNLKWLQREDGAELVRYGIGRENQEDFFFQTNDLKFYFLAHRWNYETDSPSDTYIVVVKLHRKKCLLPPQENEKAIVAHAKEIESGLLAYPLIRYYEGILVKEVLFDINPIGRGRKLVRAEDVRL